MIKVLVPDMPTVDDYVHYLRSIDNLKIYSNDGPLVQKLESRIGKLVGSPFAAAVSNATMGLTLALKSLYLQRGSKVLVPAVTFVASGQAILDAGLTPIVVDVDPVSWQLTSHRAREFIDSTGYDIKAVMPVASFGMSVDANSWHKFCIDRKIPVVIDAAGSINNQQSIPLHSLMTTVYSLHATKFIGCGEGGIVCSNSLQAHNRIKELSTFGTYGGTNGKLSEYHAAVGLAASEPQRLERKESTMAAIRSWYSDGLNTPISAYFNTILPVILPEHCAASKMFYTLKDVGIETKMWYRPYLHHLLEFNPTLAAFPVADLLSNRLLGLPFHTSLSKADVVYICDQLKKAIGNEHFNYGRSGIHWIASR